MADTEGLHKECYGKVSLRKAGYISLAEAVKESIWLKGIISDFGVH